MCDRTGIFPHAFSVSKGKAAARPKSLGFRRKRMTNGLANAGSIPCALPSLWLNTVETFLRTVQLVLSVFVSCRLDQNQNVSQGGCWKVMASTRWLCPGKHHWKIHRLPFLNTSCGVCIMSLNYFWVSWSLAAKNAVKTILSIFLISGATIGPCILQSSSWPPVAATAAGPGPPAWQRHPAPLEWPAARRWRSHSSPDFRHGLTTND